MSKKKPPRPPRDINDYNCTRVHAEPGKLEALRLDSYSNDRLVAMAAFMNAAGNDTRIRILYVLWRAGELCVCDLADIFEITQPAVSRHLKILREKALVDARRDAQTLYYRINAASAFSRLLVRAFEEQDMEHITADVAESAKMVPPKWPLGPEAEAGVCESLFRQAVITIAF